MAPVRCHRPVYSPMHLPGAIFWTSSARKVFGFQPGRCQTDPSRYSILLMMTVLAEVFSVLVPAFIASTTCDGASGLNSSISLFSLGFVLTTQKNCRSNGFDSAAG